MTSLTGRSRAPDRSSNGPTGRRTAVHPCPPASKLDTSSPAAPADASATARRRAVRCFDTRRLSCAVRPVAVRPHRAQHALPADAWRSFPVVHRRSGRPASNGGRRVDHPCHDRERRGRVLDRGRAAHRGPLAGPTTGGSDASSAGRTPSGPDRGDVGGRPRGHAIRGAGRQAGGRNYSPATRSGDTGRLASGRNHAAVRATDPSRRPHQPSSRRFIPIRRSA
jgi:hypothetical protein